MNFDPEIFGSELSKHLEKKAREMESRYPGWIDELVTLTGCSKDQVEAVLSTICQMTLMNKWEAATSALMFQRGFAKLKEVENAPLQGRMVKEGKDKQGQDVTLHIDPDNEPASCVLWDSFGYAITLSTETAEQAIKLFEALLTVDIVDVD